MSLNNGFAIGPGSNEVLHVLHPRLKYPHLWQGCLGSWFTELGPSGPVLRDSSGMGRHGDLTNMDAASDWITVGGSHCLSYDGTNDYVQIAGNAILSGKPRWAIDAWIRPTGTYAAGGHPIYCERSAASGTEILKFELTNTPDIRITYRNSGNQLTQVAYTVTLSTSSLTHVGVTLSSAVFTLYVSGKIVATGARTGNDTFVRTDTTPRIGGDTNSSSARFVGEIAGVRIYDTLPDMKLLSSRPGIACETRRTVRSYSVGAAPGGNRRRRLLIGS